MPYTSEKPANAHDSNYLRANIPGWGVDLDPSVRPGVPKEQYVPRTAAGTNGAAFPERQLAHYDRERSTEHKFLTPVFGSTCPPRGVSGAIRRMAYRRYSEGQSAHWLLLLLADRIDVIGSAVTSMLRGRPDNIIAETGIAAELTGHPIESRFGQHRTDMKHQPVDVLLVGGQALIAGAAVIGLGLAMRSLFRRAIPQPRMHDPRYAR